MGNISSREAYRCACAWHRAHLRQGISEENHAYVGRVFERNGYGEHWHKAMLALSASDWSRLAKVGQD